MKSKLTLIIIAAASGILQGCSSQGAGTAPVPPAKVENRVQESDLTRITLSPEAEMRLGIEVAAVREGQNAAPLDVAGEVMAIPGQTAIVNAPVSGTVTFAGKSILAGEQVVKGQPIFRLTPMITPQLDLKTTYQADVDSAKARLDTAALQLERARQLLQELAGSQRNVEVAEQEFGQAKAAYDAAIIRLQRLDANPLDADVQMTLSSPASGVILQMQVAEGQVVSSGAPVFQVADLSRVWLRVPIYAGDLNSGMVAPVVMARDLNGAGPLRRATRVEAPPTADPLAVTADLYFELANERGQLRPGLRLAVLLPSSSEMQKGFTVPASSILYDIHGGTWAYVREGPGVYRRQRVDLLQIEGKNAQLSRGVTTGMNVVTAGAAELFGTEFGAGR